VLEGFAGLHSLGSAFQLALAALLAAIQSLDGKYLAFLGPFKICSLKP
jgi:hypothetical protein